MIAFLAGLAAFCGVWGAFFLLGALLPRTAAPRLTEAEANAGALGLLLLVFAVSLVAAVAAGSAVA